MTTTDFFFIGALVAVAFALGSLVTGMSGQSDLPFFGGIGVAIVLFILYLLSYGGIH
jgi:uncharacterized membrane protein YccC